ncbi:MAG: hypothetical protein J6586_11540 [Snodgrassella sp.]|nr:hypothetical protein [Snodgrassella sp.]
MGTAAKSHISKIETEQAKILRTITNDPWYVRNDEIRKDLGIPTVQEEIKKYAGRYRLRIATHSNRLAVEAINAIGTERRLKRKHPEDLTKEAT